MITDEIAKMTPRFDVDTALAHLAAHLSDGDELGEVSHADACDALNSVCIHVARITTGRAAWEQEKAELLRQRGIQTEAIFEMWEMRDKIVEQFNRVIPAAPGLEIHDVAALLCEKLAAWEQREKQHEALRLAAEELLLSDLAYDEVASIKLSEAVAALTPPTETGCEARVTEMATAALSVFTVARAACECSKSHTGDTP